MISGKEVAEAIFLDLESFFYESAKFKVAREYNPKAKKHASFIGSGAKSRIQLSVDFCNFEAKSMSEIFFITIIICHECAHYLHKHNNHKDDENLDFTAIENWADYFGGRIFGIIITFGKKTQALMTKIHSEWDKTIVIESIGLALKDIYLDIYLINTDERYSKPIERVFIFNSGFLSFFYRLYNELDPDFILWLLISIMKKLPLSESEMMHHENINLEKHTDIAKRSSDIHKKIQSYDISITLGVKAEYARMLITNYNLSSIEVERNKDKLTEQANRIFLKLDSKNIT